MSHVIAIANQKGGVGKTTTAVNLGASLAAAEQRVLVIDMDSQCNATSGLGVRRDPARSTLYEVLLGGASLASAIQPQVHLRFLDVVPATRDLAGVDVALASRPDRHARLRHALSDIRELYDFVLIDCSPAISLLTLNTLVAADTVLIPLQTEYYSMAAVSQFSEVVDAVRGNMNRRLGIEGVLLTMYDGRLKLAREVEQEASEHFGSRVFRTRIPRNVSLAEAPSFGKPALVYDINSPGAQAYLELAKEIILRAPMMLIDGHRVELYERRRVAEV